MKSVVDILGFGAHPDDIEFACGGILARSAATGKTLALCDLTLGEKGSNGTPEGRKKEALEAASLLNAERLFLNFSDCEIVDTYEGRLELVKVIRQFKPKLVLAPLWKGERNHPDHIATGLMARYACRYARFGNILPDLAPHTVEGILHYPPSAVGGGDFLIDITEHMELLRAMIRCHESQLKTRPYLEWVKKAARQNGFAIGVEYAQGLYTGNPIAIDDLMNISRGTLEI